AADERHIHIVFGMSRRARRNSETIELLFCNLFCVGAHDEMHFMSGTVNLLKQSLQINRSARPGRSNHKFHCGKFIWSLNLIRYGSNKIDMVKKLLHTRYRVKDLEKTVAFYRDVLGRSEEHTSELQSPYDLVCRLLLEKKKKKKK